MNHRSLLLILFLTLSAALTACGSPGTGPGTGPGTLQFSAATYSGDEDSGDITVTATRTGGSNGAVSVDVSDATSGTATSGTDYSAISTTTLSWADGDTAAKTITVSPVADGTVETDETVDLILANVSGATLGTTSATTVTIVNDDVTLAPGSLQFSATAYSVAENGTSIIISVTRAGGDAGAASVNYADATGGSATTGADYVTIAGGTLNWTDGDGAPKTFSITITDDVAVEGSETINLSLSGASGASLGTPAAATVTITDYEEGSLQFSSTAFTGDEEGAGSATLTLTRTGGSDGAVSVDVSDDGTGSATGSGTDYSFTNPTTINWADGDTASKTATVTLINDDLVDPDETVDFSLGTVTGGATIGTPAATTLTVSDSDVPGSLQFTSAGTTISETAGTVTFYVERVGGVGDAVSVDFATANGTAASGADYTANSGTLNWAAGDSANKSITVTLLNDTLVETNENFTIVLSSAGGGASLGSPTTATVTLTSDDAYGDLQFSASGFSVNETDGTVTTVITLQRVNGSSGAVSVDVTDAGTGSATGSGTDYTFTSPTTVSWIDGNTADKTVTITLVDDSDVEGNETVDLTLGTATGGASIGTPSTATVTIVDDETPLAGELQFNSSTYSVAEDDGSVTITVTRINGSSGAVGVSYATSDGTATAGSDYTTASSTLSWADGETTAKTFSVNVTNDTDVEGDETISLALTSPTGGASLGTPSAATLTINDDDTNLTMNIGDGTYWVAFRDGPGGTWTEWSPTSGNTYDFPVTDGSGRYGVAFHRQESVEKIYVIHATVGELASLNAFRNTKYTVSGTLTNYTGSNDSAFAIMHLDNDWGATNPYPYSLSVPEGLRDFFASEDDSTVLGPPTNFVIRRDINITGNRTENVNFTSDTDVEALTYTDNNFFGSSTGQLLEVYFATSNGTSLNIVSDTYDGSTAIIYPYVTNASVGITGDAYSFQISNGSGSKYRIRNKVATTDPGTQSMGLGSLVSLTSTAVSTTQTTGLSYTPDPTSLGNDPVFRGFQIDLDQSGAGTAHWQIKISDGWLGASTSYTHPSLSSISGFLTAWDMNSGTSTNATVSTMTTNSGTGLGLVFRKTMGGKVSNKLAQKDTLKLDIAKEFSTFTW